MIAQAMVLVLLLTPESVSLPALLEEVMYAIELGISIVPVHYQTVNPEEECYTAPGSLGAAMPRSLRMCLRRFEWHPIPQDPQELTCAIRKQAAKLAAQQVGLINNLVCADF